VDEPLFVVFNPHAGLGRGAGLVEPVLQALDGAGRLEHGLTRGPGDEVRLVAEALGRGFRRIVAVGGDGTWSLVGGAIVASGTRARLGLVPGGTGCDLARSLGIPQRDIGACARIVRAGRTRTIDVGRVEGRHFLNIAGFGYDVAVLEDSRRLMWVHGSLRYLVSALRQLRSYRGFAAELEADGRRLGREELLMLVVANARAFGGGFRIAPRADLDDGRLDAFTFANMGLGARVTALARLLAGTHDRHPGVHALAVSRLVVRFDRPPAFETDGEWNQAASTELVVEAVPKALDVMVPAS
jgi:diacylglycerol kinase (ATP)